jgi:hypothetical protein
MPRLSPSIFSGIQASPHSVSFDNRHSTQADTMYVVTLNDAKTTRCEARPNALCRTVHMIMIAKSAQIIIRHLITGRHVMPAIARAPNLIALPTTQTLRGAVKHDLAKAAAAAVGLPWIGTSQSTIGIVITARTAITRLVARAMPTVRFRWCTVDRKISRTPLSANSLNYETVAIHRSHSIKAQSARRAP